MVVRLYIDGIHSLTTELGVSKEVSPLCVRSAIQPMPFSANIYTCLINVQQGSNTQLGFNVFFSAELYN